MSSMAINAWLDSSSWRNDRISLAVNWRGQSRLLPSRGRSLPSQSAGPLPEGCESNPFVSGAPVRQESSFQLSTAAQLMVASLRGYAFENTSFATMMELIAFGQPE
jgi:hypothetical protein